MAAPRRQALVARAWARDLGIEWTRVLLAAGITNRTTPWRIDQGMASLKVLHRIEDVLRTATHQRGLRGGVGELVEQWADAGAELATLDPALLATTLAHVRRTIDGARRLKAYARDRDLTVDE